MQKPRHVLTTDQGIVSLGSLCSSRAHRGALTPFCSFGVDGRAVGHAPTHSTHAAAAVPAVDCMAIPYGAVLRIMACAEAGTRLRHTWHPEYAIVLGAEVLATFASMSYICGCCMASAHSCPCTSCMVHTSKSAGGRFDKRCTPRHVSLARSLQCAIDACSAHAQERTNTHRRPASNEPKGTDGKHGAGAAAEASAAASLAVSLLASWPASWLAEFVGFQYNQPKPGHSHATQARSASRLRAARRPQAPARVPALLAARCSARARPLQERHRRIEVA